VAAWTGSAAFVPVEAQRAAAGAAVVAALLSQQVQPALAKDVLLTATADPSERIAAPLIDNSNLVKGVPFAGENAARYAPQTTQSEDDLCSSGATTASTCSSTCGRRTAGWARCSSTLQRRRRPRTSSWRGCAERAERPTRRRRPG
ncbi:unnamed protein product, partial [Prorocentrum cordatum]